jgi:16S rRNA (cytosine967-C5)-methyltransferase
MSESMPKPSRVPLQLAAHAADLLTRVLEGPPPADRQMEQYFRQHRRLGVRDRGFVAETVYGALRHLRLLRHVAGADADEKALICAELLRQGLSARALESAQLGEGGELKALAERLRTLDVSTLPLPVRANMPDWLVAELGRSLDEGQLLALAEGLNRAAPLDIRTNTLKANREQLQARLADEGIDMASTPYSPLGLRRKDRAPLFRSPAFQDGWFEVQDEGSQLLAMLVEPRRREMVADYCAGAGGKTLMLGAMMANTGMLYAFDIHARRLADLRPRLIRAGLDNVRVVALAGERDPLVTRLAGKMHRVLVDAPCTGTGTLRRNPDIKWRPVDLPEITAIQGRILARAATLVRPGGRLVYATCSLLPAENEDVVAAFLAAHASFRLLPVSEILARQRVDLSMDGPMLRLYPHLHGTDGFFAAVLEHVPS